MAFCEQVQGCEEVLYAAEDQNEDDDGDDKLIEVRFAVEEEQQLGVLFSVFSECQALHPDDVEQDEGEFMFNVEEVEEGALGNGSALSMPAPEDVDMLVREDGPDSNPDRFADADEQ